MSAGPVEELLVSGTLTLDTTHRDGIVHRDVPGGSALYAAAAASLLLPVRVVGTVGTDFPFDQLRAVWRRGVERREIEVLLGPTFRWQARYSLDGNQRETLSRDLGVTAERLPPLSSSAVRSCALLLGSTDPRVQAHVRDHCRHARLVGLDSMSHWWIERRDALHTLVSRVQVLFLNERELALAVGEQDPRTAVARLQDLGPELVVVKRGTRGAWLQRRGAPVLECPAVALPQVVDPTGAGDAFAGAFLAALVSCPELGDQHALRFATTVASFAVEGVGADALARASRDDVERRMASLDVGTY